MEFDPEAVDAFASPANREPSNQPWFEGANQAYDQLVEGKIGDAYATAQKYELWPRAKAYMSNAWNQVKSYVSRKWTQIKNWWNPPKPTPRPPSLFDRVVSAAKPFVKTLAANVTRNAVSNVVGPALAAYAMGAGIGLGAGRPTGTGLLALPPGR